MSAPGPSPSDPDATDVTGRVLLGRFRVESVLGRGGMGEVLLAFDTLLQRRVALKHLRADGPQQADRRSAILKEARRASQVSDHRIAAIHDVLDLGDDVLLVMEYVEGTPLRERLRAPLPLETFWRLSGECVEALGAAHAKGVIHRDIKPENLMLTPEDEIKILDFGLALQSERPSGEVLADGSTNTIDRLRVPAGTPLYMAPEAHYGGHIDERTDIFSLGAVFYEMLTARHPFAGSGYDSVVGHIMHGLPEPVDRVNPAVPAELSRVVERMLARDPAQRFASCEDVSAALAHVRDRRLVRSTGVETPTDEGRAVQPRSTFWSVGSRVALALVSLAAVAAIAWRLFGPAPLPRDRNLAVLLPTSPATDQEFEFFALGMVEMLVGRLQRHEVEPGFQIAPFREALDQHLKGVEDARKLVGANLALIPTLEQTGSTLRARLELCDTRRGKLLGTRRFEVPLAEPVVFAESLYQSATALVGLEPRRVGAGRELGVRGNGTLRLLAQGLGRASVATTEDDLRLAREVFESACRAEPDAAAPRAKQALAELRTHTLSRDDAWLDRAEASARKAVELDAKSFTAHFALAEVLSRRKRPGPALREYERATELEPTHDAAFFGYASARGQAGDASEERAAYVSALERRPHLYRWWWVLADWEWRHGNVRAAAHAYSEMIRRAPGFSKGYSSLGGMLVQLGEYERAIDTLRLAASLRPTSSVFNNLGTAYFNTGRLNEAVDAYNQALQFGAKNYRAWLNLGDAYFWLRDRPDQARDAYLQALPLAREELRTTAERGQLPQPAVMASLAGMYAKLGQPDSSRAYLAWALSADSANSQVQYTAALTLWQLRDRPGALTWLERAVHGGYPTAWLHDSPVHRDWRTEPRFAALLATASAAARSTPSPETGGRR